MPDAGMYGFVFKPSVGIEKKHMSWKGICAERVREHGEFVAGGASGALQRGTA